MGVYLRAVRGCREQQRRCAAEIARGNDYPGGARLGASDWLLEEIFIMDEIKRPRLIGLCGYAGVGKDAAAALLAMIGYLRMAFADGVRSEVSEAITGGMIPIAATQVAYIAGDISKLASTQDVSAIYAKPTSESMRRLLQWWGTEFRRAQNPDYWTDKLMRELDAGKAYAELTAPEFPPVVISDVRFPNEAVAIRKRGGVIWRLTRAGVSAANEHSSETVIDDIKPDAVIANDGPLIELAGKLLYQIGNEAKPARRGRPVGSKTKKVAPFTCATCTRLEGEPHKSDCPSFIFIAGTRVHRDWPYERQENPDVDTLSSPPIATMDEAPWGRHADGNPLHGPSGLPEVNHSVAIGLPDVT